MLRLRPHRAALALLGVSIPLVMPAQPPDPMPPAAQALLDRARAAAPARAQFALDHGAVIQPTGDGRSFYLIWRPAESVPLITTLHGSASWAFDEFFLWQEQAEAHGYGIVALQWWFGAGDGPEAYYAPADLHRELRTALRQAGVSEGGALLHGFSRGAANLYGVAALDRREGDRLYAMFLANAGGASTDFPPNLAVSNGSFGANAFSGTCWSFFCGGLDPNPERDGCPAMRRTAAWIEQFGGAPSLFIEDAEAGHGGFHQTPAHIAAALDAFRDNLALRVGAPLPDTRWQVTRDPSFELPGASTPNAGFVGNEVWLMVGGPGGPWLYRSADGSGTANRQAIPGLPAAFAGTGFGSAEIVPRTAPDGRPELYVLGLAPPGVSRSALFRLRQASDGRFVSDPSGAVFGAAPGDPTFIGVPDITAAPDGRLRLTYVRLGRDGRENSRTAISNDGGASFTPEFSNPFGDIAVANPSAINTNVDPAILRLADGGYLAITMRSARLYVFTSIDGRTFVPSPMPAIEPSQLSPGAAGLFDPTLVQLPDGRIFCYATAAADLNGTATRVVRAKIAPEPR
jgi:hypothetical protein